MMSMFRTNRFFCSVIDGSMRAGLCLFFGSVASTECHTGKAFSQKEATGRAQVHVLSNLDSWKPLTRRDITRAKADMRLE